MVFGEKVRRIREIKGWKLAMLAERASFAPATLYRYEDMPTPNGIQLEYLNRLADALEIDLGCLTDMALDFDSEMAPSIVSQQSLKRFLTIVAIPIRLHSRFQRVYEDPAAPKSIQQWEDFWRLVQRFSNRRAWRNDGPGREADVDTPILKKPMIRVERRKAEPQRDEFVAALRSLARTG